METSSTLMAYFRMYFRNGWDGKWFPQTEEFEKRGLRPIERNTLKSFCEWVDEQFPNGCDEDMRNYISSIPTYKKGENGRFYTVLDMDSKSFAEIEYNVDYGNDDYIIRAYLYRKLDEPEPEPEPVNDSDKGKAE